MTLYHLKIGPKRRMCTMMRKTHQHLENPGRDELENMRRDA